MFYVTTLDHEIVLEPVYFGPKLRATIVRLLKEEVEGLALANYGYVVNVIEVLEGARKEQNSAFRRSYIAVSLLLFYIISCNAATTVTTTTNKNCLVVGVLSYRSNKIRRD